MNGLIEPLLVFLGAVGIGLGVREMYGRYARNNLRRKIETAYKN